MAASRDGVALDDQLLKKALKEGRRRANVAASSLWLGRVGLLRIHQRCKSWFVLCGLKSTCSP